MLLLLFIVGAAGIGWYIGRVTHPEQKKAATPVSYEEALAGYRRPKLAGQII